MTTLKTSAEALIDHPAGGIDLEAWLANLSDRDYQACSSGHRAGGTFREHGRLGSVNVESVGAHLLIQHYVAARAAAGHLVMHSRATRVYVLHVVPATIEVIWTLRIEVKDSATALFRCTVETRIPTLLAAFATLALLPHFLRRHVQRETPLFARDIERKLNGSGLTPANSLQEAGHD